MLAASDEQIGSEERPVSEEIPELFHYTSIAALSKIIQSQTLRATRTTHLNDSTETELIWPRITPIVVNYYRKELDALAPYDNALKIFIDRNGGAAQVAQFYGARNVGTVRAQMLGDTKEPTRAPVFVVSFSTHSGDSESDEYHRRHGMLSQWRGYCDDDGVAIVFDTSGIEKIPQDEEERFECWPMSLSTVVYDSKDLRLEKRFDTLFEAWGHFLRKIIETKGDEPNQVELDASAILTEEIGLAFARFKHAAFHEENECRIVVGVTPESISIEEATAHQHRRSKALKTIHYRSSRSGSIPYIELFKESDDSLPITRIIVGPSRNQQANLETVQGLARTIGIEVTASETPFVGSFRG